MSECTVCSAKSQLFLCTRCQGDLRETLTQFAHRTATNPATGETRTAAGWLEMLEDAALGRTRLGESARRSTERNTPLPVNLGASAVLDDIHHMLIRWVGLVNVNMETVSVTGKDSE